MKYPLGGTSNRTAQIRYNFVSSGIYSKTYLGFVTFTRNMCGKDFIERLADGRVTFDVMDKGAVYDSVKQFKHKTDTAITIQF